MAAGAAARDALARRAQHTLTLTRRHIDAGPEGAETRAAGARRPLPSASLLSRPAKLFFSCLILVQLPSTPSPRSPAVRPARRSPESAAYCNPDKITQSRRRRQRRARGHWQEAISPRVPETSPRARIRVRVYPGARTAASGPGQCTWPRLRGLVRGNGLGVRPQQEGA